MKISFVSLLMAICACGFSQKIHITISAQNKSITVSPGDDNANKVLDLQASITSSEAYLTAKLDHEEIDTDWERKFIIYDNEDSEMDRLVVMKENIYGIPLKSLLPTLQKGKEYRLYTIIFPKDPQKAMEVKIARQLLCKIKLSD